MKKKINIGILLLALLTLVGCTGTPAVDTEDTAADTVAETETEIEPETEAETEAETEPEPEPIVFYGMTQSEVDEKYGALLDGLFTGKTTEEIVNPNVGGHFYFHFPDIVYLDGEYFAYYITYATHSGKGGVGLAISTDGENWENQGCVIQPDEDWDVNGAYFAGVWLDTDGTWYLAYECNGKEDSKYGFYANIALATSTDGFTWEKQGVILYKDTESDWQNANVGTPDLFKVGDTWYLTFHGYDFEDCQIGVAYGEDLFNLTVVDEPVLPTVDDTYYSGTTGRRDVIYVDGWYYMVLEVSTDAVENGGFAGAVWNHMFARSRDMIHWEMTDAPKIENVNPGFGFDGNNWIVIDGDLYIFMRIGGGTMSIKLIPAE